MINTHMFTDCNSVYKVLIILVALSNDTSAECKYWSQHTNWVLKYASSGTGVCGVWSPDSSSDKTMDSGERPMDGLSGECSKVIDVESLLSLLMSEGESCWRDCCEVILVEARCSVTIGLVAAVVSDSTGGEVGDVVNTDACLILVLVEGTILSYRKSSCRELKVGVKAEAVSS